jgi:hypothetical protein
MINDQEDERRLNLNKGVELMLRQRNKRKKEEPSLFFFNFGKMVTFFNREFHFHIEFQIKKRNS